MSALESSIENLTSEYTDLSRKLDQIDQDYRVERPTIVAQISQLARALSALTGKPVAGATTQSGRKPMSEAGKAAIKAGLEKSRAAKAAASMQGPLAVSTKPVTDTPAPASPEPVPAKKSPAPQKGPARVN